MMKIILFVLMIVLPSLHVTGQGEVNINYSQDIQQMKESFVSNNRQDDMVKGWRIQIITTDDRRKMEAAVSKFKSMYPNVSIAWNHQPPYYRVKVGAYENKMQLMGFLLDLKQEFRGVIPVIESINKSELVEF